MIRGTLRGCGCLALIALAALGWTVYQAVRPAPALPKSVTVEIQPGASAVGIAGQLTRAGVLRSRWPFLALYYLHPSRRSLKAGEYEFDRPLSPRQVYEKLARGEVAYHMVTIPEGFNIFEVAGAVAQAGLAGRKEFLEAAHNTALLVDLAPNARSLEGFLFPDTYRFSRQTRPEQIAAAMVARFRKIYADLERKHGPSRPAAAAQPLHVVTMASLVEKETSLPGERPLVAGVYYNRLAQGLLLQCDPTVIYAALLAGRYRGTIHQSDLEYNSPYNTYVHAGLPPGPIANPGRASLEAALQPQATDYRYFVSNVHGGHVFARSLPEHERNVAQYRRKTNGGSINTAPAQKERAPGAGRRRARRG